jgi:acyl carrier protein
MGLDSVALLVDVEKHFDITIQNNEASNIYTLQDFADCVFKKVTLNPSQQCKSQVLFYRLRACFIDKLLADKKELLLVTKIKDIIRGFDLKEAWPEIENAMNLKLPTLSVLDFDPSKEKDIKILGLKFWRRRTPVTEGTISDLVYWMLSLNYNKLIDPKNLCNKADIERIVIGITSEATGIPVDEIKLEHSITGDLGID